MNSIGFSGQAMDMMPKQPDLNVASLIFIRDFSFSLAYATSLIIVLFIDSHEVRAELLEKIKFPIFFPPCERRVCL